MSRNIIIAGGVAALLLVLAVGGYLALSRGGDGLALAQLDRLVRAHDGSYESAVFAVEEGRLIVDGLVLRNYAADPDAEPLDLVEVGRLDVAGLARFNLLDAINSDRAQQVFSSLEATDIALTESGQTIRLEAVRMRDVSFDHAGRGAFTDSTSLSRAQVFARAAALLNAGELHVTGFQSPEEGPTGMRLAELDITGIDNGTIESITAHGLSLWDEGQIGTVGDTVSLEAERVSMTGIDASMPLRRLANGEQITFDRQSDIPIYRRFAAEGVLVTEEGDLPLTIEALAFENESYEGVMPTRSTWSLNSLNVPLRGAFVDEDDTAVLRSLGYDELDFSFVYRFAYDFNSQEFALENASMSIAELGELEMQLQVSNVPFTAEMIDQTADTLLEEEFIVALLGQAAVRAGSLSVTDRGIFERIVETNAGNAGLEPDVYLTSAIADLEARRQEVASSELAVQTIDALVAFFEEPGTISVTTAPEEPVPLQQLVLAAQINPVLLVEILDLRVSASAPAE